MLKLGIFCFVIIGLARQGISEKCQNPPAIANGVHSEPSLTLHGTQVTYYCDAGHYMVGGAVVTCPASASMSKPDWGPVPSCKKVCLVPYSIPHGSFNATFHVAHQGTVVDYTCDDMFAFKNDTTSVTCLTSGTWSTPYPECIRIACPPIPAIDNGFFADYNTTDIGTLVEYSCAKGYSFQNVSTITCLDTAQWSLPLPVCLPPDCYPIATVDNGYPVGNYNNTVYGSVVNYECDDGYYFTDTNQTKCLITGYWGLLPECVRVKHNCGPFPVVENGNITEADNNTEIGALAMYACAAGYELIGNETVECLSSFYWTAAPSCKPVCDDPPLWTEGSIISPISKHNGATVQYNCTDDGFRPVPTDTITCENGTWSALPAACIKPCNDSDIIFLLDSSGSVGTPGFQETKRFVTAMVEKYPLGKTHFGMATFSTGVQPQFNLNTFTDKDQMIAAINSTNYTVGSTQTDLALEYARTTMLDAKNGRRQDAIPAVVIVTDGVASNRTEAINQAQLLKDQGVAIYSVAVGPETYPAELQQIASKSEYVFNVEKYSAITTVTGPLSEALCNVVAAERFYCTVEKTVLFPYKSWKSYVHFCQYGPRSDIG